MMPVCWRISGTLGGITLPILVGVGALDGLRMGSGWAPDGLWMGSGWALDGLRMGSGWAPDGLPNGLWMGT
jgi:hypothetical protein